LTEHAHGHAHPQPPGAQPFPTSVGCAVLTVSDSRTLETDKSGALAAERLAALGHRLVDRQIVVDDVFRIRQIVAGWIAGGEIAVDEQLNPTFKPFNFIELLPRIRGVRP